MPRTSRATVVYPLTLRELRVARIEDVTPWLRRVTLGGDQLGAFTSDSGHDQPAFRSDGFDDSVRLHPAHPGAAEPALPAQKDGRLEFDLTPRPLTRYYTVRRYNSAAKELDLDFVRHGTGAATTWAYRAQVGDRMHISGPAMAQSLPDADWMLVVGDETAAPAIARLLEEARETLPITVIVECAGPSHRSPLTTRPGTTVTWLDHGGQTLLDAVRALDWPAGRPYAWLAGETGAVRDLRRHLVEERGLPKTDVEFTGYWKRAEVVALADDPALPDPEKNPEAWETLHELAEILPPLAIRAAVTLEIPDRISRGVTTTSGLATNLNLDPTALGKLLRYLHAIGIVEPDGPGYKLSPAGDYLTDEDVVDVLHPDGAIGRMHLAFAGLAESVRTGGPAYASVTGQDYAALRREQWYENRLADGIARIAPFLTAPLAAAPVLAGHGHIVVHSDGAGPIAQAFATAHPHTRLTLVALPSHAAWLKADLPELAGVSVAEQSVFEESPAADLVLFAKVLAQLPDRDLEHALRRATVHCGRVLVLEDVLDDAAPDEHEAEADLLNLTLHGSGNRTDAEWRARFAAAGLTVVATHTIGWGFPMYELTKAER